MHIKRSTTEEFTPEYAVVDSEDTIIGLFRNWVGARAAEEAYNKQYSYAGTYKVIAVEEAE